MDDIELLRDYAKGRSEAAFTTLVERYIALVYSAAVRQVRNPHLAEEVTQAVFMILASKARTIRNETPLSGWLYRATRFVSADVLKNQYRRQLREKQATEMQMTTADDDPLWEQVSPLLDEAMAGLSSKDRDAVLLRFFENKTLAEVGAGLGATEEAARKRVNRAVDKLRTFFIRRGCAIPAVTMVALLSAKAVQAAPAGLISSISATGALSGAALHQAGMFGLTKTLTMTTMQKAFLATAITTAISTGIYHVSKVSRLEAQLQASEQHQKPLDEQIQLLRQERDEAMNRLGLAQRDSEALRQQVAEIPKLRGEVARLRRDARESAQIRPADGQKESDPLESAAKSWAAQVSQLRQRLEQTPDKKIPELQFVTDQDWFDAVGQTNRLQTDADFRKALERLRRTAKNKFVPMMQLALSTYTAANDGQLPTDLAQLKPYFESPIDDAILQRYALTHTGRLSDLPPTEPLVVEKTPVDEEHDTMYLIYLKGTAVANAKGWPKSPSF
jgi:RNA polymerase sigma factor (sigma-70 family)